MENEPRFTSKKDKIKAELRALRDIQKEGGKKATEDRGLIEKRIKLLEDKIKD